MALHHATRVQKFFGFSQPTGLRQQRAQHRASGALDEADHVRPRAVRQRVGRWIERAAAAVENIRASSIAKLGYDDRFAPNAAPGRSRKTQAHDQSGGMEGTPIVSSDSVIR